MNENLKMTIHKVKSIKHATFELPMQNGVYAIVGNNGAGKSTIIYSLAQLVSIYSLADFGIDVGDGDSYVEFDYKNKKTRWNIKPPKKNTAKIFASSSTKQPIKISGMYEGSLFFGFRFKNSEKVNQLLFNNEVSENDLIPADAYIVNQLGYILHGDEKYYENSRLVRIKNRNRVKELELKETPYFMKTNNVLTAQFSMSSGESLMLSLLHFIYHSIIRRSLDPKLPVLMLIDEIELALHPIAVTRLLELLHELVNERTNLIVYITSHSPEVISKILPRNMFKIEPDLSNEENSMIITNPCYPSYAIRDVYRHDGYDWLVLVEDELAKTLVENEIASLDLSTSKLIHITPVGGWSNVLKLHHDLYNNNVLGVNKKIISILDGDIRTEAKKNDLYRNLPKLFLPIASVEKYLKQVLLDRRNRKLYKAISDDFFQLKPLSEVIQSYRKNFANINDTNGKIFFSCLLQELKVRHVSEREFVSGLAKHIKTIVNFSNFNDSLARKITSE